jgi:hypothetical protein
MQNSVADSARESLVSDIPAGDRKNDNLFLQCTRLNNILYMQDLVYRWVKNIVQSCSQPDYLRTRRRISLS